MATTRSSVSESCSQPGVICMNKCKAKLLNGVKCVQCGECYHRSCAKKLSKVKFLSADDVLCCESAKTPESDLPSSSERIRPLPDNADMRQLY